MHTQFQFYSNQVIRAEAKTPEQLSLLVKFFENGEMDFWTLPSIQHGTDIMVRPDKMANFQRILDSNGISFKVIINDVEQ